MSFGAAARIARREMRGGIRGFRVFLACLAMGVAAIAAIGSVRESIQTGLDAQGARLLGGDAEIQLTYRFADAAERAWMESISTTLSEIVDFRSMAVFETGADTLRGLTQIKAVDAAYPIYGTAGLDPPIALADALNGDGARPGAVMDRMLSERLGMRVGDTFRLGANEFVLSAILTLEPDSTGGFSLGPRTIVRRAALDGSGLLAAGTLFESAYRLALPPGSDLDGLKDQAVREIRGAGGRWRDARNGAPGTQAFVDRLASFLILVSLAGLTIGGVGVSAAVRAYLDEKIPTIATLKTIGAEGRTIFSVYMIQIGALSLVGIALGLVAGALLPNALTPLLTRLMPVAPQSAIYIQPLLQAAAYGVVTAALFALWPLSRTENIRAAVLFRDAAFGLSGRPRAMFMVLSCALLVVLITMAVLFTGEARLTLWATAGLAVAFATLSLAGLLLKHLARAIGRLRLLRGQTALRHALSSVGGPGSETATVVISLGLGLSVLAAIGQIDTNLRTAITQELPEVAPSFFFVDIQTDQLDGFIDRLDTDPDVSRVETAPMLRGIITRINGLPAQQVVGPHWVISGDRGITYSETPPANAELTAGQWWPQNYTGQPQISFSAHEAEEMGLDLGDELTINVLGREITGTITSLRNVDFSDAGIGFVLSMNPAALKSAPHSHIATVYATRSAEGAILRDLATAYPNITAIGVRDAINRAAAVLEAIASAITYGAYVALATGGVVLVGAAAAGERARTYEAAILKTLGSTRAGVLLNFSLRSAIMGLAAGVVAIAAGGAAGWAVMTFVMELSYRFEVVSALQVVLAGVVLTSGAGALFALRSMSARPARMLRARE